MIPKDTLKRTALAIFSGILGFLAFPPADLSMLAWVCLVPLFLAVKDVPPKQAFLYTFLSGTVFFGSTLYWLVNVTVPGMIVLIVLLALVYGIFGSVAGIVIGRSLEILILPFAWVVLEFIRGGLFTGFPWALLGHTQYENLNLIQISDITGAYGVSFLLVAFNAALFTVLMRSKRKIACMMTVLLFIIAATSYGMSRSGRFYVRGQARLSVVQGNIPQRLKWDPGTAKKIIRGYSDLAKQASADSPDLIIWPETSYPYLVDTGGNGADEISGLSAELKVPILAGVVVRENGSYYNGAVLFNAEGEKDSEYRKLHLVPFGEYVPFEKYLSFLRERIDKPIGDFVGGDSYTLFPLRAFKSSVKDDGSLIRNISFFKFGVLICFEDIFPYVARGFVSRGANFLVNITNDAWFGETAAARQHLQSSVFRAVENRVPVIRAANTGISGFIAPSGRIISLLEEGGKTLCVSGYETASVNIYAGKTYYTVYGDMFVYFCGFMLALLFIVEGMLRRKNG